MNHSLSSSQSSCLNSTTNHQDLQQQQQVTVREHYLSVVERGRTGAASSKCALTYPSGLRSTPPVHWRRRVRGCNGGASSRSRLPHLPPPPRHRLRPSWRSVFAGTSSGQSEARKTGSFRATRDSTINKNDSRQGVFFLVYLVLCSHQSGPKTHSVLGVYCTGRSNQERGP